MIELSVTDCPHCKNRSFKYLVDENKTPVEAFLSIHPVDKKPEAGLVIGGPHVPVVFKACEVCGFTGMFNTLIVDRNKKA